MATIDLSSVNANFAFAGNPIIVKAENLGFTARSIFRQVVFKVETLYDKSDDNKCTFMFAVNAEGGVKEVTCDISSALRSAFAQYQYSGDAVSSTESITYPAVTFKVSVYTKWMLDGAAEESDSVPDNTTYIAFLGGLSDYERWSGKSIINAAIPTSFSTKPSGEVFVEGQLIATSGYDAENRVVKTQFSTAQSGVLDARDRTTILFVNSRGVFETISVAGNDSEEYEITSEVRSLVGTTAYSPSPYITTHKEGGGAVWKMSSGWVNKEWARWYAREFLMAKQYWLLKDDRWLPVSVVPDSDSIVVYDKNEPSLLAVNFTMRSAIKG